MTTILDQLKERFGERVKEQEPLSKYTTLKIGGPADIFLEVKDQDECIAAIRAAYASHTPVFILGGGSNILIGDKGIRGLVIKNAMRTIVMKGAKGAIHAGQATGKVYVEAESGVIMNVLVRFTVEEGLSGLEAQLGLPGTVGGAMYMNSKWTHPESYVGDCVYQATIITPKGDISIVPKSYFQFAYDSSVIQKSQDIVISVVFELTPAPKEKIWDVANASVRYRRETQPQGIFSPGCTFRNISKAKAISISTPNLTTSAGFLVDHAGLKGVSVGEAQISTQHANFIQNKGKATAADVVQLIETARAKVKEKFGVTLVEEIVRVGEF